MKKLSWSLAFALVWLVCQPIIVYAQSGGGSGPSLTALTCNEGDVAAQVALVAADNTTINIPGGTCIWATTLTYNPTFTTFFIGAGASSTILQDNEGSGGEMFVIQIPVGKYVRISGMTIEPYSMATGLGDPISVLGTCNSSGCPNFRLDNMTISGFTGSSLTGWIFDVADVFGVADHNTVTYPSGGGIFGNVSHASYLGVGQYGDNSWTQPDSLGTGNAFYFEDNTVQALGAAPQPSLINDCDHSFFGAQHVGACRIAIRHNTLINAGGTVHGTESGGRSRGGRQIEIYDNQFTCNSTGGCSNGFQARSGVVYEYGNTFTTGVGSWFNGFLQLAEFRRWANLGGWDTCNGAGPWDNNDGTVYASGTITATSGSGGSNTLVVTDSTQHWTMNEWAPGNGSAYSIVNLTLGNTYGWEISGSTTNSVSSTLYAQDSYNNHPVFNVGDSYQILKASVCIDQPSRSLSTLLSGATPPTGWVNEVLDPAYEWNDTLSAGSTITFSLMGSQTLSLIANRDWYQESATSQTANTSPASPFNGTSGTGWGTFANRPSPTSCSLSVGYSTIGYSSDNSLYQCQSGAWVAIYTPYTYPHPLTTGVADESFTPTSETFPGYTVVGSSSQNEMVTFAYTGNGSLSLTKLQASTNFSWNKAGITSPCAPETTVLTPTNPSCAFNVAFVPGQTLGTVNGNVTATFTGDPNNSSLQLPLQGTSTEVTLSPKALAFGTVSTMGATKDLSVTVTNKGTTPLQFGVPPTNITGTGSGQFMVLSYSAGPPVDSTCLHGTVTLSQNQTCTFTVEFKSTGGGISYNEILSIFDNDGASPQTVSITAKD